MDTSPRALGRRLPFLAAALGIEAIGALIQACRGYDVSPEHLNWSCLHAFVHFPHLVILAAFALAIPVMTAGGAGRIPCQRLLYGGFVTIAVSSMARFMSLGASSVISQTWLGLRGVGTLLLAVAAPGIWGSALAWEQNLSSERIPPMARLAARVSFLGFLVLLASGVLGMLIVGPGSLTAAPAPIAALSSFPLFAGYGCLLWCGIQSWRRPSDEGVVRERARRIKKLMAGWALAGLISSFFAASTWSRELPGHGTLGGWNQILIWHGIVDFTLALLVTVLVSLSLEDPGMDFEPRRRGPWIPLPPAAPADTRPIDVP